MTTLAEIAYTRSGDKGDVVSIGVIARRPSDYATITASVRPENVQALFGDWVRGRIEVHHMENIHAIIIVMHQALGGGATSTLRLDQTGKSLGNAILRLPVVSDT